MTESSSHLDFERPIVELEKRIEEMEIQAETDGLDLSRELHNLEEKVEKLRKEIYSDLSRWQRVQISRHPQRPYALDYIGRMLTDFTELHGDRYYGDDKSIVGGRRGSKASRSWWLASRMDAASRSVRCATSACRTPRDTARRCG